MSKSAVVAGHVCLDVIPAIPGPIELRPGRLYEVGPATMGTGGAVSNTGVSLHLLGIDTVLMGKIGDDTYGEAILDLFNSYDKDLTNGMIKVPGEVTSYSVVINIPGSDRMFLHCCGANHTFGAEDLKLDAIRKAGLFHFGYPTLMGRTYADGGSELLRMYQAVKELGVTTSMDMAMPDPSGPSGAAPWDDILSAVLPHVDVFLPSADEILYMIDRDNYGAGDNLTGDQLSALGEALLTRGVAVAGVKLGDRGLYLRTAGRSRLKAMGKCAPDDLDLWANREIWLPVFDVNVVSAVGAGDSTIAGFLAGLMQGLSLVEAGRGATMVGAMNVQAASALGGIRDWDDTQETMADVPVTPLPNPGKGWREDPDSHIWFGPNNRSS